MEPTMTLLQQQCRQRKAERAEAKQKPAKTRRATNKEVAGDDGVPKRGPNTNTPEYFTKNDLEKIFVEDPEADTVRYVANYRGLRCVVRSLGSTGGGG